MNWFIALVMALHFLFGSDASGIGNVESSTNWDGTGNVESTVTLP